MAQVFKGDVILPGESGPGLTAAMTLDGGTITLHSGDEVLGTWGGHNVLVQPDRNGRFLVTLGGEDLYFQPESPSEFATAVASPLQAEQEVPAKRSRKEKAQDKAVAKAKEAADDDVILEEVIAKVKPLRSVDDDDDILTPALLSGIIVVAVLIVAAVVGVTVIV